MAMVLANNMPAVNTLNILHKNVGRQEKDMAKLSTGTKINGAGDDTSGYAISERMRAQIRSLDQDIQNVKTGQNIIAVAEGAIQSITSNLRTMKEMCINAMNDHNTDQDRATLQKEYNHRLEMIKDIVAETTYNGKILLDGRYESPSEMKYNEPVHLPLDKGTDGSLSIANWNGMTTTYMSFEDAWVHRPSNRSNWPARSTGTSTSTVSGPATTASGLVQNTSVRNLASSFSAGTNTSSQGPMRVGGPVNATAQQSYYGGTIVNISFSGAVRATDGTTPTVVDFDQQGFSILCGGCYQYLNFRFDANLNNADSTYNGRASTTNSQAREYIIGIADISNVSDLEQALFNGVQSAHTNNTGSKFYLSDTATSLSVDKDHNVRIATDGSGNYFFTKSSSPALGIYDASNDPENTPTPTPPPASSAPLPKNPLVIHHGPKANQALNVYINDMGLDALKLTGTGTKTQEYASLSLCYVDYAIEYALNEATRMGAYRSRLEMTEANLVISSENTQSSESTIRDADMAKEITEFTKDNVLMQASQSMLAQANQSSSNILSLLQ